MDERKRLYRKRNKRTRCKNCGERVDLSFRIDKIKKEKIIGCPKCGCHGTFNI